jgi:hypothetical protein
MPASAQAGTTMADYILVLDGVAFEQDVRPALAASWRQRSFEPCRPLCAALAADAVAFAQRYHTGEEVPFIVRGAGGLPFDRAFWRRLVGEVLLVAAVEIPEFPTCPDALCRLLAPGSDPDLPRTQMPPILQAHRGSRDLIFGTAVYRPENAGYNNAADVARLAEYLAAVRTEAWTPDALAGLEGAEDEEARTEELACAREALAALRDLYRKAHAANRVVVVERIW